MELFVSYAREDAARVAPLAAGLEENGWKVFWDRKIASGKSWHEVLEGALTRADRVIVVWSEHSIKSSFVRDEAARAQAREILVPVLVDDVPLPLGFGQIQTANLVNWSGDANAEAFRGLLADLGSPASAARQLSSAPPISATDRPPPPARRTPLLLGSAAALACALGVAAYIATRPQPKPVAAVPVSPTLAASHPAPAAASATSLERPAIPRPQTPKQAALKLLHAYYDAINSHRFEAARFFAPRPSHYYLWFSKPGDPITLSEIDAWMKGHANRSEMDDSSLEQSPSGTFSYIETQFVPQKTGRERPYTALVAVDINDQHRITRLQTVEKRPR